MSTETMTTAPSTDAPHLTRAQTDYIALTAPEDDTSEQAMWATYHAAYSHARWDTGAIDAEQFPGEVEVNAVMAGVRAVMAECDAKAAHLRARHRAELLAELAEMADRDPLDLLLNMTNGITAINAGAVTAEWLRGLQADATRPVEGRADR